MVTGEKMPGMAILARSAAGKSPRYALAGGKVRGNSPERHGQIVELINGDYAQAQSSQQEIQLGAGDAAARSDEAAAAMAASCASISSGE